MAKTLISGGTIVTVNQENDSFDEGWILLEDDRIVDLGNGNPPDFGSDVKKIDAKGKAVLPGIVNIHTHVCGSIFKALTEDIEGSFYGLAFPMERFLTPESTYSLSMLGCIESVKFGSTIINDLYHFMRSTAKAVDEIGLRGVLAQKVYEVDLQNLQYDDYSYIPGQGREKLDENIRLIEEWHGKDNGRIQCRFGPHATDTLSMELAKEISDLSDKYKVGIHTHAAQKTKEIEHMKEAYSLTPVEYLKEVGFAGDKLIAAHCVYVNDSDIQILKDTGTNIAQCPEMMLKRGYFPPMRKFLERGLKVSYGTDWVSMNPWDNMRSGIEGARIQGVDVNGIHAKMAFRKSTIEAAEALGMENEIGSLEKGKKADLLIMGLEYAHLQPIFDDILATIVYNATGMEIETVMIDGKTVVSDGKVTTVDEKSVMKDAVGYAHEYYNRQMNVLNKQTS
jgi:5-methylthioadenosine/S-adenosylhomocysteine deaminase